MARGQQFEVPPDETAAQVAAKPGWSSMASAARAPVERGDESLADIAEDLGNCTRCVLCETRKTIVFGVGDPRADLLVVGEAPGFHEDQAGEPFVGQAGQMLDKMLLGVFGLQRSEVYLANVVKCQPPKNRNPLPDEVGSCMPFLERQIGAIRPKVLLVLGTVAFKNLFQTEQGIMRNRGKWRTWNGIPALPTFHPAYLLRKPEAKRDAFADLKACNHRYNELGGRRTLPSPF